MPYKKRSVMIDKIKNNLKSVIVAAAVSASFLIPASPAFAEFDFSEVKKEGDLFEKKTFDIDGDGAIETIALRACNLQIDKSNGTEEIMSYHGRLTVLKNAGGVEKTLWEASMPPSGYEGKRDSVDFIFGDFGLEVIEAFGNITATKAVEIISPSLQSDLRPVTYRLFRWDNKEFKTAKFGVLKGKLESPDKFSWSEYKDADVDKCSWVGKILNIVSPGVVEAEIFSYNGVVIIGKAILKYQNDEFIVESWKEKPRKVE